MPRNSSSRVTHGRKRSTPEGSKGTKNGDHQAGTVVASLLLSLTPSESIAGSFTTSGNAPQPAESTPAPASMEPWSPGQVASSPCVIAISLGLTLLALLAMITLGFYIGRRFPDPTCTKPTSTNLDENTVSSNVVEFDGKFTPGPSASSVQQAATANEADRNTKPWKFGIHRLHPPPNQSCDDCTVE
jgi:hypothetical protein